MYCTNILCVNCTKPIVLSFLSFVCASLKGTLCSITSKYIWIYLHQCYFFHVIASLAPSEGQVLKHCQRHNGPRVLRDSTKLTKLGDVIAISNLKLSMTDSVLSPQSSVLSPQSSVFKDKNPNGAVKCYMYHSIHKITLEQRRVLESVCWERVHPFIRTSVTLLSQSP